MDFKLAFSRLTGRHVLGPGVFWSTLGFGFLAHALGSIDLGSGNALIRAFAVVIAHVAMMLTAYLTRAFTWRLKPGLVPFVLVIAGFVAAGAVRGLTLQYALYYFHVVDTGFLFYRLIGGVVVMTTGLIWAALAFGIKAEWGTKRANLKATKQQLESLLKASESRLELEASDTMSTIESMLQTALLPELALSPQSALTKLQSLINDTLRPLSAALTAGQQKLEVMPLEPGIYRFRWRTLLRHLTLRESSRPFTMPTILSVLAVNGFVKYIPAVNPLILLGFSWLFLVTSYAISKFVLARWVDRLPVTWRIISVGAILFSFGFGGGMTVLSLTDHSIAALAISTNGGIASMLLGALFGINHAANQEIASIERQLVEHEYRLRWTIAALNCQHWLQKKQLARKIHGPIQSEVAAAAIRIERSIAAGEVVESGEAALQNLRDRLAKILGDNKATSEVRPVLDEIAETWYGLCEIKLDLTEDVECRLREDPVCVETVLEIAREACSNAIRHGSAEHIALKFDFEKPDLLQITVRNDGARHEAVSQPGMGSAYLDDCTFSHNLTMSETETILSATVPFRSK